MIIPLPLSINDEADLVDVVEDVLPSPDMPELDKDPICELEAEATSIRHYATHRDRNKYCEALQQAKMQRSAHGKSKGICPRPNCSEIKYVPIILSRIVKSPRVLPVTRTLSAFMTVGRIGK